MTKDVKEFRCTHCKGRLHFSFVDEIHKRNVYQCVTVGVETQRTIGAKTHLIRTVDHSEWFFVKDGPYSQRVTPARLGKEASEAVLKKAGWSFEKDAAGRKIVPTVWTAKAA